MSIIDRETEIDPHRVNIDEIEPLEENITITFRIIEQNEIREIYKRNTGETQHVCDFVVADETAQIILTLWQDEIDEVEVGQVYKLENGFANIFQNSLYLAKGRNGVLTKDDTEINEMNSKINKSAIYIEDPRRKRRKRKLFSLSDRFRYNPRKRNRNEEKKGR